MRFLLAILILITSQRSVSTSVSTIIQDIRNEFQVPSPINIFVDLSLKNAKLLIRDMSKKDVSLNFLYKKQFSGKFAIVFVEKIDEMDDWKIQLDQQVFFVIGNKLIEKYEIFESVIIKQLGIFDINGKLMINKNIEKSFLKRRSNFQGGEIIAMTEEVALYATLEKGFETFVPFHKENNTFEVSNVVSGFSEDLLTILKEEFNFTTKSFTRKDRKWGTAIVSPNGSLTLSDGMIQNLAGNGKADIIATGFSDFIPRNLVVDFLHHQADCDVGIFIKKGNLKEDYDFEIFFRPLDVYMWIVMGITALIFAVVTLNPILMEPILTIGRIVEETWNYFKNFFAYPFDDPNFEKRTAYKIVGITSLLSGFIIWTSYTAFLTSELAIPDEKFPFEDLESLARTNYKLLTGKNYAWYFNQAKKETPREKVYKTNMDEYSFDHVFKSIQKLIDGSEMAYFGQKNSLLFDPVIREKVDLVWTLKQKLYGCTFAVRKGSPYREFFDWKLDVLRDSGVTQIIEKRHTPFMPKMKHEIEEPITWKKLAFLWTVIALGFLLSAVCLIFEILITRMHQRYH